MDIYCPKCNANLSNKTRLPAFCKKCFIQINFSCNEIYFLCNTDKIIYIGFQGVFFIKNLFGHDYIKLASSNDLIKDNILDLKKCYEIYLKVLNNLEFL